MAERLAPGQLRIVSDERVFAHNRRNEEKFSDRHFLLCFVIRYLINFVRLSTTQFAKKRDKREMTTAEEGPLPKATCGRVRTPKAFAK